MPTGLAIPVRVNATGGLELVSDADNDLKVIMTALGADDNDNAFQQKIGLGEEAIFAVSDAKMRSIVMRKLREIFRKFEALRRYALLEQTISWEHDSNGQATLSFKYVNTETDTVQSVTRTFTGA